MLPVKKRVESDGSIALGDALALAKIQPGDWVVITPAKNKIIIKTNKRIKSKGTIRDAAGVLKDCDDLVEKMLQIRENEDDRLGTSIQ